MGIREYSFIFLLLGILLGMLISKIMHNRHKIIGVVQVDHNTGLCKFCITNDELGNMNTRTVVLTVNHNAIITEEEFENSQEKQGL